MSAQARRCAAIPDHLNACGMKATVELLLDTPVPHTLAVCPEHYAAIRAYWDGDI